MRKGVKNNYNLSEIYTYLNTKITSILLQAFKFYVIFSVSVIGSYYHKIQMRFIYQNQIKIKLIGRFFCNSYIFTYDYDTIKNHMRNSGIFEGIMKNILY